jgi:hypothetical protein
MSKPETIQKWKEECEAGAVETEFRKLGLDGTRGQIFCIAWAFDDEPVTYACAKDRALGNEVRTLSSFIASVHSRINEKLGRPQALKWIGHYITGFDLRFIWQRCVVNNVKPSIEIPYKAKPWDNNVFDTCIEWKGSGSSSGSMEAICKAFGIEGKGDMDGSKVYDEYLAGNYQKIIDYCKDDVERVRKIYKQMNF